MSSPNFNLHVPGALPLIARERQDSGSSPLAVTGQAVVGSAHLTLNAGKFLLSPEYSLFILGVRSIMDDSGGGFLQGFGTFMGSLMIMASPVWGIVRVGVGVPGVVVGTAFTLLSSAAHGVNWVVQKLLYSQGPSTADLQRQQLTKQFVARMLDILQKLPYNQAHYFKQNVAQLISMTFIATAFRSRNVEGKGLLIGDQGQVLRFADVKDQDEVRKGYFEAACEIKAAIQSLRLADDDAHAWQFLLQSLENPPEDANERETLSLLSEIAWTLSKAVTSDELFMQIWKESI